MFDSTSGATGWLSIVAIITSLAIGIWLRRFQKAPALIRRMRPHYILGYAALALAGVHTILAMGAVKQAGSTGIQFATAALLSLGLQTFVGASLQDPGGYRRALRVCHIGIVVVLAIALLVHVTLDGDLVL